MKREGHSLELKHPPKVNCNPRMDITYFAEIDVNVAVVELLYTSYLQLQLT